MTDDRMERIVSGVLRGGVLLSTVVTLAGCAWLLMQGGQSLPGYHVFRGEPAELRSLRGTVRGILDGHPLSLIQLGVMLMIATPVARVIVSLVSFLLEGDRLYAVIASIVLVPLLASLMGVHW